MIGPIYDLCRLLSYMIRPILSYKYVDTAELFCLTPAVMILSLFSRSQGYK